MKFPITGYVVFVYNDMIRSHRDPHMGDMVLITREKLNKDIVVVYYVEGYNLKRQQRFHYKVDELEKVEEKCSKSEAL